MGRPRTVRAAAHPPDETRPELTVYNNRRPGVGCAKQWLPMPCEEVLADINWRAGGVRSYTVRADVETLTTSSPVGYGAGAGTAAATAMWRGLTRT